MITHPPNVSAFYVSLVARNPKDEDRVSRPTDVLVDTGSELSWLPGSVLEQIGLAPRRRYSFATATGAVGFGVTVDNIGHRLLARPMLAV